MTFMDADHKTKELELIKRFKEGDRECFDELVLLYSPRLYRVAYGLLGNKEDAEEVVQDAFVRAYKGLSDFRGDASFETWMHRITVNLSRNRYHWNRRRGEGLNLSLSAPERMEESAERQEFDVPDSRMEPDRQLENTELERNIMSAMKHLPATLREAMILRHVEDLPYEKIAGLLDCKVGTVKSRLARGRGLLRGLLAGIDGGKGVALGR